MVFRICEALRTGGQLERLFPFTYTEFLVEFRRACEKLGVKAVPYQARHSGPSIDAALGLRTREEIRARGRWASAKSVLRYESKARLGESVDRLPTATQGFLRQCEARLEDLFMGRILPSALQPPAVPAMKSGQKRADTSRRVLARP